MRHAAVVLVLLKEHIVQILLEEGGGMHVEAGGAGEGLRVAGPAQALVALGAVGWDIDKISSLAPYDIFVQAV